MGHGPGEAGQAPEPTADATTLQRSDLVHPTARPAPAPAVVVVPRMAAPPSRMAYGSRTAFSCTIPGMSRPEERAEEHPGTTGGVEIGVGSSSTQSARRRDLTTEQKAAAFDDLISKPEVRQAVQDAAANPDDALTDLLQALEERIEAARSLPVQDAAEDPEDETDLLQALEKSVEAARSSRSKPTGPTSSEGATRGRVPRGSQRTKLTVALPPDDLRLLDQIAEAWTNKTTALIRAIRMAAYLHDAASSGSKVIVEDRDGSRREIVIL